MAKKVLPKVDGISAKNIAQIRTAIRRVWAWSTPRKLVIERCTGKDGWQYCEKCKKKAPKIFVDHIEACGDVLDGGYIQRMFTPSKNLQGLCKKCHDVKTKEEMAFLKLLSAPKTGKACKK